MKCLVVTPTVTHSDLVIRILLVFFGLIFICSGLLSLSVARQLIRGEISRKEYMGRGIKIKEALASDEAWYRINRGGGKAMIIPSLAFIAMGLITIACAFLYPSAIILVAWIPFILVSFLPLFGYVIWVKRTETKRKTA